MSGYRRSLYFLEYRLLTTYFKLYIIIVEGDFMAEKTNVMRLLEQKKILYTAYDYSESGLISGTEVADFLKISYDLAFKTLVTVGKSGKYYVFDIPVDKELDLRKAASAVGEKNIAMLKSKDLLGLTGYIHGGCSPVGMKKFFTTTFDLSVSDKEKIYFSGGKIGAFVGINYKDLSKIVPHSVAPLTLED